MKTLTDSTTQAAPQKYDDVLLPFLTLMRRELHANCRKGDRPGWLGMDANTALLEIYWHAAKLSAAVKNNDGPSIQEFSADVANMAMMVLDVCGGLAWVEPVEGSLSEPAKQDKAILPAASAAPVEAVEVLRGERAAFEAAMRPIYPLWTFQDDGTGGYHNNLTEAARIAWHQRTLVAQPPQAVQEVRMLTEDEESTFRMCASGTWQGFAAVIQRKFCEVNGLKLAAISATTKED